MNQSTLLFGYLRNGYENLALELIPKMSNTAINQISSNKYTALISACYKD